MEVEQASIETHFVRKTATEVKQWKKILQGVHDFRTHVYPEQKSFFEHLAAKQQRPVALFITCSDSRILPNVITNTEPGELFQIRNAGNLVPPFGASLGGEVATVEYAVTQLGIRNIIICGHSQCGAMQALLKNAVPDHLMGLKAWFRYAMATRQIVEQKFQHLSGEDLLVAATEENILVQVNHLSTHPCVAAELASGNLRIYGWYYDIRTGAVRQYDQRTGCFVDLENDALAATPMPVRFEAQVV